MSACAQKSQKIMSTYFLYTTFHSWIYHYILQLFNQHEPCCSGLHTHSVTLIKYNTSQVITCCRDWTTVTPGWASCLNTGAITESPSCSCSTSERSAPARSRVADTQGACRSSNESTTIMPPGAQSGGRPCRCAILPDWYADCSHRCPIAVDSSRCVKRRLYRPRTRLKFGERSFSVAGPQAWNRLPTSWCVPRQLSSAPWKLSSSRLPTVEIEVISIM